MGRLTRHSPSLFGSHFPAHNCCSFAASLLHIQMDYLRPAAFTLLPFVGSIPGGRLVKANMGWLDSLQLPPWNPPKWVFGPACMPAWDIPHILSTETEEDCREMLKMRWLSM